MEKQDMLMYTKCARRRMSNGGRAVPTHSPHGGLWDVGAWRLSGPLPAAEPRPLPPHPPTALPSTPPGSLGPRAPLPAERGIKVVTLGGRNGPKEDWLLEVG